MDTVEKYARYVTTSFVKAVEPVLVARAAGAEVYGADGRAYLDCFAGIAVVNAGHVHPRIAEAAKAQIDQLIHAASYVYYVPSVADLAEVLASITPGALQKTFFCNSEAEALEGAMRLAKIVQSSWQWQPSTTLPTCTRAGLPTGSCSTRPTATKLSR